MSAMAIPHNRSSYTVNQSNSHDGDGEMAREVDTKSNAPGYANTTYYLHSSALGGAIVEEINSSGQKSVGYVYSPGGQRSLGIFPTAPFITAISSRSTTSWVAQFNKRRSKPTRYRVVVLTSSHCRSTNDQQSIQDGSQTASVLHSMSACLKRINKP